MNEVIEKVYNDPAGFGSFANTLKEARKINPTITSQDVKDWVDKVHTEKPTYRTTTPLFTGP